MDASGGNYDDAFQLGVEYGRAWLARELLTEFVDFPGLAKSKLDE